MDKIKREPLAQMSEKPPSEGHRTRSLSLFSRRFSRPIIRVNPSLEGTIAVCPFSADAPFANTMRSGRISERL